MTNFEFYKDDIYVCLVVRGKQFALIGDKIIPCDLVAACSDCKFHCAERGCNAEKFEWLYQEHVEKHTLSNKERLFCELAGTGYIARDEDGLLFWWSIKPKKDMYHCEWSGSTKVSQLRGVPHMNDDNFPFINWEDEEPWAVEDLLKLEVRE